MRITQRSHYCEAALLVQLLQAAYQVLKQALDRDVRPVTEVLRAMQELSKCLQPQEGEQYL